MHTRVSTAALALAAAVLLVAPAFARPAENYQINVTLTDRGCTLQQWASRRYRLILFQINNNGSVPHRFTIWGVRSGWIPSHQEGRFFVKFRGPGRYGFACLSHHATLHKGTFTIRKS